MIYKKHELSKSLNGDKIVYIARNAIGNVIFRESSEQNLKDAIDKSLEEQQRQEEQEARHRLEIEEKKQARKEKRALFAPLIDESIISESPEVTIPQPLPMPQPQPKPEEKVQLSPVKRGPDGKFISKSQVSDIDDESKKKSFWERLR